MANVFYFDWEISFIEFLQNSLPSFLIKILEIISNLGEEIALIIVVGTLYWCIDKRLGKRFALMIGVCNIFYPMIKNVALRSRPYLDDPAVKCIKSPYEGDIYDLDVQGYSFPSGHASNSATVYGGLALYVKKKWFRVLMTVLIVLICLSRVVLGVHYPTDVLAGLAAGFIVLFGMRALEKHCPRKVYYPALAVLGAAGFFYCTSTDYYTGYGLMLGAILADIFEEKYVNFENAGSFIEGLIRVAGGFVIFLILSKVLKMPFSESFLESKTFGAYAVRALRYTLMMFIDLGVYPMLFKYIKIKKKK